MRRCLCENLCQRSLHESVWAQGPLRQPRQPCSHLQSCGYKHALDIYVGSAWHGLSHIYRRRRENTKNVTVNGIGKFAPVAVYTAHFKCCFTFIQFSAIMKTVHKQQNGICSINQISFTNMTTN